MKTSLFYGRCKICLSDLKTHIQKSSLVYKTIKSPCCFPPSSPLSAHTVAHTQLLLIRLLMSKNVCVMSVMSGGLQESTMGV